MPLGSLGACSYLPCTTSSLGEANLVSINSAWSKFSWFAALHCRRHICHARTPNNANSVSGFCSTKLYPTLVFIGFIGNENKIPRTASEDNLSSLGLVCAAGISGPYLLAPWHEFGLPHVQIEAIVKAHNFGINISCIRVRLSLRICIGRSCYSGLREYLSGWVDLVGKPPSPLSFTCWCFGPWVIWSIVHFVSWLVKGFMISS
jgi:hypothetical protein